MKIWIDTEFNEKDGELLSIALVNEYGKVFYSELPTSDIEVAPWVQENVLCHFKKENENHYVLVRERIGHIIATESEKEEVEVIADHPADIWYFSKILSDYVAVRDHSVDFSVKMTVLKNANPESKQPHHAYFDALALRDLHLTPPYNHLSNNL